MPVFNNILAGAAGSAGGDAGFKIERSLRFNDNDNAHLTRTFTSSGNRKIWTASWWMKLGDTSGNRGLFGNPGNSNSAPQFFSYINGNGQIEAYEYDLVNGGHHYHFIKKTQAYFRDPNAWYHCVFQYDSTQSTSEEGFKIYVNGERITSWAVNNLLGYAQNYQSAFNSTENGGVHKIGLCDWYFDGLLAEFHFIDGQALGPTDFGEFDDNGVWQPIEYTGSFGPAIDQTQTWSSALSDSTGFDSGYPATNAFDGVTTAANTARASAQNTTTTFQPATDITYTSKVEVWTYFSGTVSLNGGSGVAVSNDQDWRTIATGSGTLDTLTFTGSSSSVYLGAIRIDGVILVDPGVTVANNGFHLDFSDNSSNAALGTDSSGNSNTWTVNNLSVALGAGIDSLIDTPTNYEASSGNNGGNYCTLNPLESALTGINNGNLNSGASGAASWKICTSTLAVSSGKYYWEGFTDTTADSSNGWQFGFCQVGPSSLTTPYGTGKWSYQDNAVYSQSSSGTTVGTTASANDLLAYALDMDAGTCKLYVNNSLVHTFTGITGTITPFVGSYDSPAVTVNFGQRPFAYTPPTGYVSLCTANLPDPTIADGSTAFDTKLYTGNGTSQTITGYGFSPDFAWFKSRSGTDWHALVDTVRGKTKVLFSNTYDDEETRTEGVSSFNSDGFGLGDYAPMNKNNDSIVAWAWDAGSSNTSISAGGLNSSAYAQDDVYSDNLTSTGSAAGSVTYAFDGNTSGEGYRATGGVEVTFDTALAVNRSVVIYYYGQGNASGTLNFNDGGEVVNFSGISDGQTLSSSTITSLSKITMSPSAGQRVGWTAVEVDGKILVDSNVTPPNVPSIASTVRANPSAGFSIINYTGTASNATIGHGLNAAPGLVIIKKRNNLGSWTVWHQGFGTASNTDYIYLDSANQQAQNGSDSQPFWNNSVPTSSVVNLGTGGNVNGSSDTFVAYCWAPVEGYSAFGSYTGNGSADGPFVYTGFSPAFFMVKVSSTTGNWIIFDKERPGYNPEQNTLCPNLSSGENASGGTTNDFLSNGFKIRGTSDRNTSGATYVWAAFAEHPFKTSRAR